MSGISYLKGDAASPQAKGNTGYDFASLRSSGHRRVLPPLLAVEPDVQVVFRWKGGRASNEEVRALQRLLPELRDRSLSDVVQEIRSSTEWILATCHPTRARGIASKPSRLAF